ncbi:hypothetical protein EVAR_38843_1 [Eumeta japonica]|uniref:Uncharacterized protein n=1 Tax=Eumeta variegata TaxID=151549 RepID=A0A4C1XSI6_EUMVA|nr:hypothetical protein EVAR_38843_1 [Eumeta japonica]
MCGVFLKDICRNSDVRKCGLREVVTRTEKVILRFKHEALHKASVGVEDRIIFVVTDPVTMSVTKDLMYSLSSAQSKWIALTEVKNELIGQFIRRDQGRT